MCVDFRTLNQACPKDTYPLPRIDTMVDRTFRYEIMSFLDAFSGYHQIRMAKEDEEKTAFITDYGTYCYVMPFGLKNVGATYQRMIDAVFKGQRGKNLEAYVDDILVKSKSLTEHLSDLREMLDTLRNTTSSLTLLSAPSARLRENSWDTLAARGIEANPDKISAILNMPSPKTAKEIQKLGMTAVSTVWADSSQRLVTDVLHSFDVCATTRKINGLTSAKQPLELKKYLTSAPILVAPKEGTILSFYLGVFDTAVSAILLDNEKGVQHPIFYTSHMLLDTESRYPTLEKLALALLTTARKLRSYFQSHTIQVVTDQPLLKILRTLEVSGRLLKWSIELGEYDIRFVPRTAIKAQALTDFIAELSTSELPPVRPLTNVWSLHVDGASGSQS
ncbi:RNA-directed DNA polymerase like [Apostasia shenzhenica]|uniref:RNA-directed DNA polymerase like n=1 Tax=Apostasia shenzhenica TaxID=1088818 RepID=A0A2I0B3D0_9ASPA|nr:RNA-directed DNA polymerase like [Apostasia shenzhenica]